VNALESRAQAHEAGVSAIAETALSGLPRHMRRLDAVALSAMTVTLHGRRAFRDGAAHTAGEVADLLEVVPRHRWILRRWFTTLQAEGWLARDGDRYRDLRPVGPRALEAAWPGLDAAARGLGYPPPMRRFFRTAIERLPALLRDEVSLQALLFPDGDQATAEGAYRDNVINRYVNAATGRVLADLTTPPNGRRPVRMLEFGAGVGGTTADLLPVLAGEHVDYLFTDVTRYFLDTARERFADHPFLSYALFDINGDLTGQGIPPASQDVVLAANVAHNAVHVGRFLSGVRELIAPGGLIVLIESCREHYLAMTSMQFLMSARPGAEQPGGTDVRAGTGRVFLTRAEWSAELVRAGFTPVLDLPDPDHPLAALAQHLFVAVR
jgi:mycobactin polyketide synthetase MbtD/pyochelin synthetase